MHNFFTRPQPHISAAGRDKRRNWIAGALVLLLLLTFISTVAVVHPVVYAASNPIVTENQQSGTTDWQFDNYNKETKHEIEGYASLTSVNQGGQISFMVSLSSSAQYTMDIYRLGYYAHGTNADGSTCTACGGRLMLHVGPLSGTKQATCPTITNTSSLSFGLIECNWTPSYTLTVPTNWTTGNYLVKLRRSDSGLENYMTFVVRSDSVAADIVYSMDVTTWQAYNYWGGSGNTNIGYDLYGKFNDTTDSVVSNQQAYTVSFDRPYLDQGSLDGAGNLMLWDYPMIHWMESQGYNVTYVTDVDLENNTNLFAGRKVFMNTGHDEYYSDNMRSNLQNGINAGINMAFFSANDINRRIVWANDASGQSYRRVICDKGHFANSTTINWRELTPPQPENAIMGVMQNGVASSRPFLVYNASSWIYAGTGLVNYNGTVKTSGPGQNAIAGLIGYEFDERAANASSLSAYVSFEPPGLQQVGHSNVPASDNGVAAFSDSTLYTTPRGAIVFAAGTIQWSWGVDNGFNDGFCSCNTGLANAVSQQITTNILNKFIGSTTSTPLVSFNPSSLTFAAQNVGTTSAAQTVTVTNSGTASLTISNVAVSGTNASDFAQTNTCSSAVAPGANCSISVTFTPSANGSRSASLSITDNAPGSPQSVALSGTGQTPAPGISFNPSSLTFATQNVGTTSTAQTVTVTNSGSASLTISSIALSGTNASDFAQTNTCSAALAPNATCSVSVTFTPSANGSRSASLSITDNAPGSPQSVALSGTGQTPAPGISFNPSSLTFATQNVGTTSTAQTVTVTNSGSASLTISSIALSGTNASDFAQTNTCSAALAPNATCSVSVTFTPSANGSRSASLSITDNAPGSPQSVALSGTGGTSAPGISFNPSSLTFAAQNVGTTSTAQTVTVTNSGSASLTISSIALSGTNASDFAQTNTCSAALAPNATCSVSVTFTPSANGSRSASLTFTDNAPGSPQSVALSGTGVVAGTYFSDGFESGDFSKWTLTSSDSTGTRSVQTAVVNSGTHAAQFTNASGQYAYLYSALSGPQSLTYTRFYFRFSSMAGSSELAMGRNTNGGNAWEIDYDAGLKGLDFYFWDSSNALHSISTSANALVANTWYSIEIQDNQTTSGGGQAWLNGTSLGTVSGNFSTSTPYAQFMLYDDTVGTVYWDDVAVSNTYNGQVNPTPSVSFNPSSLTFATQNVGTTSAAQTVTVTNSGTASLTISNVAVSGTNASDFAQTNTCSAALAPNATCSVSVTFTPSANGSRSASLSITDNTPGSPQSVALSGTGGTSAPGISFNPSSLTFATQNVGTTSTAQTVTVTNSGSASLTISSIALSGTNASDFAQTNTCSAALAPNATCSVSVTFTPSANGSRSASLSITDNAPGSPQSVALSGTGVVAGTYFSDGFESGDFSKWTLTSSDSTGTRSVQTAVVNSGTHAAQFTNASGQYAYLYSALSGPQSLTYTRFYFRFSSMAGSSELAMGRNTNGGNAWEIDYDAGLKGLDFYFWDSSNALHSISTSANALVANTWYSIEIQDNQTTSGGGQAWLNGTSLGTVSGNFSTSTPYAQLMLYDDTVGTVYWDDVAVSNTYI